MPAALRRMLWSPPARVVVESVGSELVVRRESGEQQAEIGRFPLTDVSGATSPARHPSWAEKGGEVVLRLPSRRVLDKTLELPAAVEENLRQVLSFEMDRQTPFSVQQVNYDYKVVARRPQAGQIEVRLWVVPRGVVDELLDVCKRWGIQPSRADIAGLAHSIDLLPEGQRPASRATGGRVIWALGVLAVVLLLAAVIIPVIKQRQAMEKLQPVVAAAQKDAEAVQALREQLEQAIQSGRFLTLKKQSTPGVMDILLELTHILPDNTWVQFLDIKEGEVQIRGESSESSALIGLLEGSKLFRNPGFRSPVTQNPVSGRERFHLGFQVATKPTS